MAIENGSVASADEVLEMSSIRQVYTGSGFDSATSGASDTQYHELDAVGAVINSNYAVVKITGTAYISGATQPRSVQLKAQIKETGGAYADIVAYKRILYSSNMAAGTNITTTSTYEIVATLTAGMKANGFQIKVFSFSEYVEGATSFTNIQTVQEVRI